MGRTHPQLWKQIVDKYMRSSKGGDAGEWSARKAQLAVQEYKQKGGGYTGQKSSSAKSLSKWTNQNWRYSSKKWEGRGRYLPDAVWKQLSQREKEITNRNKANASKKEDAPYEEFVKRAFKNAGISI